LLALFLTLLRIPYAGRSIQDFFDVLAYLSILWSVGESILHLFVYLVLVRIYKAVPKIFLDIVLVVIYAILAGVVLHRELDVDLSSLLTGSALLTAIIGLSLKDTFGNIFAGLAIQAQRPFEVGDWIQFDDRNDHIGKVLEINWRATKVITLDVVEVIIPNAKLADFPIKNFTKPERWSRRSLYVTCPYEVPPGRVHRIILDAIDGAWGVNKTPAPSVVTNAFTDRGIEYWIRLFTDQFDFRDKVDGGARDRVWYALERNGIPITIAQHRVYLRQLDGEFQANEELAQIHRRKQELHKVDIFNLLPPEAFDRLAILSKLRHYAAGEPIIRQGEEGAELFIIRSGEVLVSVHGSTEHSVEVARLGPGKFFGEMAFLTGEKRRATIRAGTECELLVVDKDAFCPILTEHPELAERIGAVLASRGSQLDKLRAESDRLGATANVDLAPSFTQRIREFFAL
jgi:small-conductance mechanosensitive channel/CRP-like cAMP-binding protein